MKEPPDGLGKSIRFGCGFLFGAVAGAGAFPILVPAEWQWIALVAGVTALICGFLALRWGEDFWSWIADYGWWFGR